jgi:hypothetical protein
MRHRLCWLGVALIAASTASAQTDSAPHWPVATRVRVQTASNRTVVGQLAEVRGDTLVIQEEWALFGGRKRVPVESVRRIEISRDRYISAGRVVGGALGGAAAAVLTAFLVDAVMPDLCTGDGCEDTSPIQPDLIALGAVLGALGGVIDRADRWEQLPRPIRVNVAPERGEARLVLSFSFR